MILVFLQGLGFTIINANHSVFVFYDKSRFILVYLDKFFIIDKNLNIINGFKNKLLEYFYMTDLELLLYYLGMAVIYIKNSIKLDQKAT